MRESLIITIGSTEPFQLEFSGPLTTIVGLAFELRVEPTDVAPVLVASVASSDITITDAPNGLAQLIVPLAADSGLAPGRYHWAIWVDLFDGSRYATDSGTAIVQDLGR